jgi:hypothetical protein
LPETWRIPVLVKELDRGSCDTLINNIGILTWQLDTFVKEVDRVSCYIVIITINVPVVYMARYVMVLRRARSITRGIGRGGPWKS